MDRCNNYRTKQYAHAHAHTQQMVASTWLGDPQGKPSASTNSLHKLHMSRYQVLLTITITITNSDQLILVIIEYRF